MHIGIITCEILRKEIKEVIIATRVRHVFFLVPDTANSVTIVLYQQEVDRFSRELTADDGLDLILRERTMEKIKKEISELDIKDSVIIKVLELQMHDYSDILLTEIEEGIKRMSTVVDCVLLGYGLCGISIPEMERVIREAPVPVVIPRDKEGAILSNCIEIALGRETVHSLLEEEIGTFFMTPVGASIVKEPHVIFESTIKSNIMAMVSRMKQHADTAVDTAQILKLMKNHYKRVVKIWYSEVDKRNEEYTQTVKRFAKRFNMEIKPVKGSTKIICEMLRALKLKD